MDDWEWIDPTDCLRCQIITERLLHHELAMAKYSILYEESLHAYNALKASVEAHDANDHSEEGEEHPEE